MRKIERIEVILEPVVRYGPMFDGFYEVRITVSINGIKSTVSESMPVDDMYCRFELLGSIALRKLKAAITSTEEEPI